MPTQTIQIEKQEILNTNSQKFMNFLNTITTSTGKMEFYNLSEDQHKALDLLHNDMIKFNRELYAYLLLSDANWLNKQLIIINLLKHSSELKNSFIKKIENWLILQALEELPPHKAYQTFSIMKKIGCNKRIKYIANTLLNDLHKNRIYDNALKFKAKMKQVIIQSHLKLNNINPEVKAFLFDESFEFTNKGFVNYKKAKTDKEAVFQLPYSVAIGFANHHKIPNDELIKKTQGSMTQNEKRLVQKKATQAGVEVKFNLETQPLFKVITYLRENPENKTYSDEEIIRIIEKSAKEASKKISYKLDKISIIIDNSGSMYGSAQKKMHPIIASQAITETLKQISKQVITHYIYPTEKVLPEIGGASNLSDILLKVLKSDDSDMVIIISDGYENQPYAGCVDQVITSYKKIGGTKKIIHLNPVFAAESMNTRRLSDKIPTAGTRTETDLNMALFLCMFEIDQKLALDIFIANLKNRFKYMDKIN